MEQNSIQKNRSNINYEDSTAEYSLISKCTELQSIDEPGNASLIYRYIPMKKSFWRWVILMMMVIFIFANYYAYSILPSLQNEVIDALNTNVKGYNLLQASFSFPNIVLPLFVGILIDRLGFRLGIFFNATIIVLGILLEYIAVQKGDYNIMMGAVVCFGCGCEAMCIIISAFISSWFIGKELSLSLGYIQAAANFGCVLSNWTVPLLYDWKGNVIYPFFLGFIVQAIGYVGTIVVIGVDKVDEIREARHQEKIRKQNNLETICTKMNSKTKKLDYKKMNIPLFWMANFLYMFQCAAQTPFWNNLQKVLTKFYGQNKVTAGRQISIITLLTAVLAPIVGFLTDKKGRRTEILLISNIIMVIVFILWIILPTEDDWFYIPVVLNGIGSGLFRATIFPMIPLMIHKSLLGTAFGIQNCAQQLGMAVAPLVLGYLLDYEESNTDNYFYSYLFLLGLAVISLIFAVGIILYDKKKGNKLNLSEKDYKTLNCSVLNKTSFGIVYNHQQDNKIEDFLLESDNIESDIGGSDSDQDVEGNNK